MWNKAIWARRKRKRKKRLMMMIIMMVEIEMKKKQHTYTYTLTKQEICEFYRSIELWSTTILTNVKYMYRNVLCMGWWWTISWNNMKIYWSSVELVLFLLFLFYSFSFFVMFVRHIRSLSQHYLFFLRNITHYNWITFFVSFWESILLLTFAI